MNEKDIQTIHALLTQRVTCQNANEGVAIAQLAAKLVQHFAPKARDKTPEEIAEAGQSLGTTNGAANGAATHQ